MFSGLDKLIKYLEQDTQLVFSISENNTTIHTPNESFVVDVYGAEMFFIHEIYNSKGSKGALYFIENFITHKPTIERAINLLNSFSDYRMKASQDIDSRRMVICFNPPVKMTCQSSIFGYPVKGASVT